MRWFGSGNENVMPKASAQGRTVAAAPAAEDDAPDLGHGLEVA
jgi:hypothetical protein